MTFRLVGGDAIEAMQAMAESSVDAIVTDPPYGLEFMGKEWDRFASQDTTARVQRSGGSGFGESKFRKGTTGVRNTFRCRSCGGWSGSFSEARAKRQRACECANPDLDYAGAPSALLAFGEFSHAWATEALRILKPGGHLLAFGGTRTYHRLACAIEDAGFEIRDCIAWMYGSGFPKSLDVSKAIDKAAGAERERRVVTKAEARPSNYVRNGMANGTQKHHTETARYDAEGFYTAPGVEPLTPEAQRWNGWGTALKPAFEPVVLARKPLSERNVAANVQRWGTGALNIDGCRVEFQGDGDEQESKGKNRHADFGSGPRDNAVFGADHRDRGESGNYDAPGRWPANVTLGHSPDCEQTGETRTVKGDRRDPQDGERPGGFFDVGSDNGNGKPAGPLYGDASVPVWKCAPGCAVAMLDEQTGELHSQDPRTRRGSSSPGRVNGSGETGWAAAAMTAYGDTGGASRFFYCPKADREERNRGLDGFAEGPSYMVENGSKTAGAANGIRYERHTVTRNAHPTVKPVELMRWLCRMVTPKGGTVLDPFTGSGSTGVAAMREGFEFIGIEREAEYVEIARARIYGDQPLFNVEAESV